EKIFSVSVPDNFPVGIAKKLRRRAFIKVSEPSFQREIKSRQELDSIIETQRATESAMHVAMDMIKNSCANSEGLLYHNSMCLTSEWVKREISLELARQGCISEQEPIVVCGDSCLDAHFTGSGALKANESIIIDIFPRSCTTRYFSDMTRTFVKGKASKGLLGMYNIVKRMKQYSRLNMKPGVNLYELYSDCMKAFEDNGYKTYDCNGAKRGFIHSLGHGVGLDIHESPRGKEPMKAGNVVAVEPGLYYTGIGGVRLEDIVHVLPNGCENLTVFPEELEL
ncbi:MAG: Xaa-Pro peptidase family protein, partial [Nanoarchaeota archaeon]